MMPASDKFVISIPCEVIRKLIFYLCSKHAQVVTTRYMVRYPVTDLNDGMIFISERMQALKQEIQTTFKLNGLQLRLEATKYLADLLIDVAEEEREEWTEKYHTFSF